MYFWEVHIHAVINEECVELLFDRHVLLTDYEKKNISIAYCILTKGSKSSLFKKIIHE